MHFNESGSVEEELWLPLLLLGGCLDMEVALLIYLFLILSKDLIFV